MGLEPTIASLVRAALAAPSVREAAASPHWREVYVGVPMVGTVLEGYVDLLYRRHDGLVVIDHKTDAVASDADLDERLRRYRPQGAAYALAVEQATGEPVVACIFVFCTTSGPIERTITDLPAAITEVRALLAAAPTGSP